MRWFYVASFLIVILAASSPYLFMDKPDEALGGLDGATDEIVAYSTYGSKIRSLDPATCGDTTSAGLQGNFYEGLYTYHYLKRPVEVIAQLADGMPVISPDALTYTIKIARGVKYSRNECFGKNADGSLKTRTITADDFVLAFKRIADAHVQTPMSLAFIEDKLLGLKEYRDRTRGYAKGDFSRYHKETLQGVKALNEHTLQIRLTVPFPQLLYILAINNYAPVPREVIDYHLATRDDGKGGRQEIPLSERSPVIHDYRAAVATGPYYLVKFVPGGDVILRRNPDYRDDYYPAEGMPADAEDGLLKDAGKKVPFVDVQFWTFVPEANPMWQMFLSKRTDATGIPEQVYHQVISPDKTLTKTWGKEGIRLVTYTSPVVYWLAFNMEDRILGGSKALRQALCLAFNVEAYIDVLYNGRGIRAVNYVPSSFEAWKDAGPGPYARLDRALAKKKIAQARKELEASGALRQGEPITLTLDLPGRDEQDRRVGEFVRKQFRKIGVNLKVELNDWPTLQEKVENKQTQIYAMGWHADYRDAENFLQLYYGPNIKRGTNNTNYSNPEFDRLFEKVALMMPSKERTTIYARMIRMLSEDCPVLLLSEPVSFVLYHEWIHNVKPHPVGYGMFKYRRIDADARRKAGGR